MQLFDCCLNHWEGVFGWQSAAHLYVVKCDEEAQVVVLERGQCLFAFNFHPHNVRSTGWVLGLSRDHTAAAAADLPFAPICVGSSSPLGSLLSPMKALSSLVTFVICYSVCACTYRVTRASTWGVCTTSPCGSSWTVTKSDLEGSDGSPQERSTQQQKLKIAAPIL